MRVLAFLIFAALAAAPATARAEPPRGWGLGARVERGASGVGIDYWGPCYGASFLIGANVGAAIDDNVFDEDEGDNYYGITVSAGGFAAVARTSHARVAVGARLAFVHQGAPHGELTTSALRLELPLRLQWLVTERITIHTELGVSYDVSTRRGQVYDPFGTPLSYEDSYRELTTFGHPLSSLGVTYYF